MIEPYNYNDEPSGRSETLVQALEKIERLEKQLMVAVITLQEYADEDNWYFCVEDFDSGIIAKGCFGEYGYKKAQDTLKRLEELANAKD